jgi:hypothetical protein
MDRKANRGAWCVVGAWCSIAVIDTVNGEPIRDGILVALAVIFTALVLVKTRLHLNLPQRLLFLPALSWGTFVAYGLIVGSVEPLLLKARHGFLWFPIIGWSAAIAAPIIAAAFGLFSTLLMQKDAVLITTASAGIAGLVSCTLHHSANGSGYFYPYAEALLLVGTVSLVTALLSRVLLTNAWSGRETQAVCRLGQRAVRAQYFPRA